MDSNQNGGQQNNQKPAPQLSWSQPASLPQKGTVNNAQKNTFSAKGGAAAMPQKKGVSQGIVWSFIAGIIIGFLLGWSWFGAKGSTPANNGATDTSTPSVNDGSAAAAPGSDTTGSSSAAGTVEQGSLTSSASVTVPSPQDAGMTVEVSSIAADAPVWAVVYEDNNGKPGNALGAARFPVGKTSGSIELLRTTLPNLTYFVGLTGDSADQHTFSTKGNTPLVDDSGNRILTQFTVK